MKNAKTLACIISALSCANAFAGGYATDVPSAAAMGNSYAGQVTGTHNISNMFINPAVLTEFSGNQINVEGNYIAPSIEVKGATARTHPDVPLAGFGGNDIDVSGDGSKGIRGDENAFIPMFYGMYDLAPEWRLGLGINVPWGLATSYRDTWVGRYHALDSEVKSINISPIAAFKVNDKLTVAGGLQFQYFDALLSSAIDFGSLVSGTPSISEDGKSEVTGNDWAYGYKLGFLFKPTDDTKIGISYRSKIEHTLKGENDFTVPVAAQPLADSLGRFRDTDTKVDITTPETLNIGVSHKFTPSVEVSFDAAWTKWSRMNTIEVEHDNPSEPTNVTNMDWNDSWYWGIGANYVLNKKWTFRTGFAYEESPVSKQYLSPRVPLNDKYFLSFGASQNVTDKLTIDYSYIHEFFKDSESNLALSDTNNTFRGDLNANYEVDLDAVAISASYKF